MALSCVISACSGASPDREREANIQQGLAELAVSVCPAGSHIIIGTAGPDVIIGTNGADCILGGGGDDRIDGGNGDDTIYGGDGNDTLIGGNGDDTLFGDAGNDHLDGGNGNDRIAGGSGNDVLIGYNGDDDLDAGDGDDQVDGGNGNDHIVGGNGNDILVGYNGNDIIDGGNGNDVLSGDNGDDHLSGGDGDDVIVRGSGNDVVSGGSGQDQCSGSDCESPEKPVPTCATDAQCSAGQHCSEGGICFACQGDAQCDDGNVCTTDSCQPALGCRRPALPDGTACLDATVCDGAEQCLAGSCAAGTPLKCDDGLFCNGSETCDAALGCRPGVPPVVSNDNISCTIDRCNEDTDAIEHAPNDAACEAGFYCSASSGCLNIDECATGQNNCSANATCTDDVPGSSCDELGCHPIPPFYCRCKPGFAGDGVTCTPVCDPLVVASGAERCVRARPDQSVDIRLSLVDQPWVGTYKEQDEKNANPAFVNYCGPTAVKNFLTWYGSADPSYADIGSEMHTDTWDTGAVLGVVTGFGYLVACIDPICWAIVTGEIAGNVVNAGTLPGDMLAAVAKRAPPGYVGCIKDNDPSLESVRSALADGNPVIYLESGGADNLHWAVATGLYYDFGGTLTVRVANSDDRAWADFVTAWSLAPVGDGGKRGILDALFGLKPFTMIRWIPAEQAHGNRCP